MAKLFKDKAIKKNLEKFEIPNFEKKIEIVEKWLEAYENKSLHQKTESQCEQAFNQSFFVELLGHTTFPNESYTLEPKGRTEASGQKPDAILGHFTSEKNRTIAVVEIKDVKTALDRSQKREGNLSPIQQAFKYKPQYKECSFVIATNFFEIRLHKDNQLDYEKFTLESLAGPKNDYFELKKFYYLLCAENFISKTGKSKTEALLSEIQIDQEKITKEFYREYKLLRQKLIKDIVTNNSIAKTDFAYTIEKVQKIIDRIVFVCFCEDTDLLPENTLETVIKHADDSYSNNWDVIKGFFNAIDSGSQGLGIPNGYNGGLFAEDKDLNNLKISDDICKEFLEFGHYDFSEDLSVNILGHIFEQSISDIEEMKSKAIEGEEADKQKSKRKKDGIFYTPDYIVDYIIENSLGRYLSEKEADIKNRNGLKEDINDSNYKKRALTTYIEYQNELSKVKVLDPACGSGAFLVKVFDYLLAENKRVTNIIADLNYDNVGLFSSEEYIKSLLENNIYGVDLNPESVEITKLSLWLKSAQKGKKLVTLKDNIKCGNSLIDDPAIAGERAFKWEDEFKEIMNGGGFDVIVGNPPYGAKFSENENAFLLKSYKTYEYQANSYVLFYEKAIHLLGNKGILGFITPITFTYQHYFKKLRILMSEYQIKLICKYNYAVFEDADIGDTVSWIMQKVPRKENCLISICANEQDINQAPKLIAYSDLIDGDGNYSFNSSSSLTEKIKKGSKSLGVLAKNIVVGIKPYQTNKGIPKQTKEIVKEKPFTSFEPKSEPYKLCIIGSNFHRYAIIKEPNMYLKYGEWLAEKRPNAPFFKDKIIIRQTGDRIIAHFDQTGAVNLNNVYNIEIDNSHFEEKYIFTLLNSVLFIFLYQNIAQEKGKLFAEVKKVYLEKMPIKVITKEKQRPFIQKADQMLSLSKQFQEKLRKFLKLIQSEFGIEKIGKKLVKFYELDFSEFVKQLKLKKLSLEKKEELLEFFEKHKEELLKLKNQIDNTDKEIDEMVFDLYGLSEDERQIVLNN